MQLIHAARKVLGQPLILAQLLYSAAGALPMVFAATAMTATQFTLFSFLILMSQVVLGGIITLVYRSAMMHFRKDKNAHVQFRYALAGALGSALIFAVGSLALNVENLLWVAAVSISSMFPILNEWMRNRAMTLDRRWEVVWADGLRLILTLASANVLWFIQSPELYFLICCTTWLPGTLLILWRLPKIPTFTSPREYKTIAVHLFVDFIVGQFMIILPLMVLGGLGQSEYLGGVRLAQTVLGPLNTMFAAFTANLFVDGVTRDSHNDPRVLIKAGRKLALQFAIVSTTFVPTVALLIWLTGFGFRGVDNNSLFVGVVLVGTLAILYNSSAVDPMILRILGYNRIATAGRTVLVIMSVSGFVGGYLLGGVDGSLIAGFLASAIANPLCFVLPASLTYRQRDKEARENEASEETINR
jgi:hypothetical protein